VDFNGLIVWISQINRNNN